jgi:DNA modification methylase
MNIIEFGDCRQTMKKWVSEGIKVQTCVTSPPYYGLRDYGHDGQIGLEETPTAYINAMVEVFRCVWDLLEDNGTLWVNIGDSYSSHKDCKIIPQSLAKGTAKENAHAIDIGKSRVRDSKMLKSQGLKNKDLIGIPWMLAFALRADGWYLRQDIIWHKPNPMPESMQDRCTKAHEYIFLLSKNDKYYYDIDAIKEPIQDETALRLLRGVSDSHKNVNGAPGQTAHSMNKPRKNVRKEFDNSMGGGGTSFVGHSGYKKEDGTLMINENRNKRSVWTVNTKPYKGAHFAVFPQELIEPCILAGAPVGGIVLDPFMGSGTTAQVAQNLGRKYLGCELNVDYKSLQQERLQQQSLELA